MSNVINQLPRETARRANRRLGSLLALAALLIFALTLWLRS